MRLLKLSHRRDLHVVIVFDNLWSCARIWDISPYKLQLNIGNLVYNLNFYWGNRLIGVTVTLFI